MLAPYLSLSLARRILCATLPLRMTKKLTGRHGTLSEYIAGCRCDPCKINHRTMVDAARIRAQERVKRGEVEPRHGKSGYSYWGCRCDICRASQQKYNRNRRSARRVLPDKVDRKFDTWAQNLTFPEV